MKAESETRGVNDWNEHWSAYSGAAALNPAQAYRRKLVFDLLSLRTSAAPVRILDLGSGSGDFALEALHERPDAELVGLDLAASGVQMATNKVPRAVFFQQDFTQPIAIADRYTGWATHAVCTEVLEHLDDPTAMLRNVRPLLAPGCRLVITVPSGPMSAFDRHIGHRRHFTRALLDRTLRDAGFEPVELLSAGFPFFNLYRLAVIARGEKLIEDAGGETSTLPASARAAILAFSWLFRLNLSGTGLGWQLAAIAAPSPIGRAAP
jgi:2-polyprenyl-3-methyl-5-hydroxy-6-metoxy-1,4-benzoquinol methylase